MRYKITTGDDQTYEYVVKYLVKNAPDKVKVRLPNRRIVSAENLDKQIIRALEDAGARISEEYQYAYEKVS